MALLIHAVAGCANRQTGALEERYPVTPEVRGLEEEVLRLAPDAARRQQLAALAQTWRTSRVEQCGVDAIKAEALSACLKGADEDRVASLRRTKLILLLDAPSQAEPPPQLAEVRIAAALDTGGSARAMEVTANGSRVVVAAVRKLLVVDTLTGQTLRTIHTDNFENANLSIFPGGRIAVLTDRYVRGMRFWDIESGERLREFGDATGPHRLLPGGRHIAYADGDKLLIYDAVENRAVTAPASHNGDSLFAIAVSDDARKIATLTTGGTLTLWHLVPTAKGLVFSRIASAATTEENSSAQGIEFSLDGHSVWTASNVLLARWSLNGSNQLEASERIPIRAAQGQRLRRIPRSNQVVLPLSRPEVGSYLMFYDAERRQAALLEVERNFFPYLLSTANGRYLFTGTVHQVRRRDFPDAAQYGDLDTVLAAFKPAEAARLNAGPILKGLPANLQVEVIGVYEGGGTQVRAIQTASGLRSARSITIGVGQTDQPLVLVLASYEPVIWKLNVVKQSRLQHVLISGYHESIVEGAGLAQVTRIGTAYSYAFADEGYQRLQHAIRQYTGRTVSGYQGSYRGIRFSVGAGAPEEVVSRKDVIGLPPNVPQVAHTADTQTISRWRAPAAKVDTEPFAKKLYGISAYTGEEANLDRLVDAELELVASRWLASKLASKDGRAPAGAPATWPSMVAELRQALLPIAEGHLQRRSQALHAANLAGSTPFEREYRRLISETKRRADMPQFDDPQPLQAETPQTEDMDEIIAFHHGIAAKKWRMLWPEIRAHAARLAALHYQVDADPALAGTGQWEKRASILLKGQGRVLSAQEWRAMSQDRLYFTLSGLDRFLLPLGTELRPGWAVGNVTTVDGRGTSVVIASRDGAGVSFRLLDANWDKLARKMTAAELKEIDEALTASYVPQKGRWFAPLEIEWDAYLNISREIRTAPAMQRVYTSFARAAGAAMQGVWDRWNSGKRR